MKSIRMGVIALFLAIAGMFSLGALPASAGDTGWVTKTFNDGSASYGPCTALQRAFDTPFGHTIGQIHAWNNCDMYGGTQFVQVDAAGQSTRWYSFSGHLVGGANGTWDFVTSFNGSYCISSYFQIHGSANAVYC